MVGIKGRPLRMCNHQGLDSLNFFSQLSAGHLGVMGGSIPENGRGADPRCRHIDCLS